MTSFFSNCFSSPHCLGSSFLHLKIFKIHFNGGTLWFIQVAHVFLAQVFIHTEESKKPGFTFSIRLRRNSKIFRVILWSMLSNISRSKGNQTMKFGQFKEYSMRYIFLQKSYIKCDEEASPSPFHKKIKIEHISGSTARNVIKFVFI